MTYCALEWTSFTPLASACPLLGLLEGGCWIHWIFYLPNDDSFLFCTYIYIYFLNLPFCSSLHSGSSVLRGSCDYFKKEKRRENSNNPPSHRANLAIRPFVEEIEIQPRKYAIILSTFFFFVFFFKCCAGFFTIRQ